MNTRREFIKKMSVGFCCLSWNGVAGIGKRDTGQNIIRFGVISDVHQDLQHDAAKRLQTFIDAATDWNPDFIIQLGDLSHGEDLRTIKSVWEKFPGAKYSVLGNHDTDHSTKAIVTKELNMPSTYYSFDQGNVHFVVLDLNFMRKEGRYLDFEQGNYFKAKPEDRDLISPEQLQWLKEDLAKTEKPTVLFSHQGLDEVWLGKGCPNREAVREVIHEEQNRQKVIACFCGHHHVDAYEEIDGIHYFQINSASYFWSDTVNKYSNGHMIEYKDALYTFVTLNLDLGRIEIDGVKTDFLPPAPTATDFKNADKVYPFIRDRIINI